MTLAALLVKPQTKWYVSFERSIVKKFLLIATLLASCGGPEKSPTINALAQGPNYVQWQGETWEVLGRETQNGFVILHLGIRGTHPWLEKEQYISEYSLLHQ